MMALGFCGTRRRANICNICGSWDRFLSKYFWFHLSVSFHQCSILVFIYMLLLADRQVGEAWEPSEKQWSFVKRGTFTRRVLSFNFKTSAQTQPSKSYPNLVTMQPFTHKLSPTALLLPSGAHSSSNAMLSFHRHPTFFTSQRSNRLPLPEGRMGTAWKPAEQKIFSFLLFSLQWKLSCLSLHLPLLLLLLSCILAWSLTWQLTKDSTSAKC